MKFRKPVFRWVVGGNSLPRAKFLLKRSVKSVIKIYGDCFDYVISCNEDYEYYRNFCKNYGLIFHQQIWDPDACLCRAPSKASQLYNTRIISGSIWKICPPRVNPEGSEIVCDNDIILLKSCKKIDEFLKTKDRPLLLEDPNPYYGAFTFHPYKNIFFNSGLYGLPPNYDFASLLKKMWNKRPLNEIHYDDEQGLITSVLSNEKKFYLITKKEMPILLAAQVSLKSITPILNLVEPFGYDMWQFFKDSIGFHFAGANRREIHRFWQTFSIKNL